MTPIIYVEREKGYGFFAFVGDCLMVCLTLGFWLIWIFCREMRRRSRRYPF